MKNLRHNQEGLIPLLICLFAVMVGIIVLVYLRVLHAQ